MATYNVNAIEKKWQSRWKELELDKAPTPSEAHPAYYILVMFPYPSGHLHMGHVRNYTIGDVLARFHRQKGFSVMHPIGWDSFGLPAENAAIKNKVNPATWTWANIAHMRDQLKTLAISYDWDREVATCDPTYYRWNQWIFTKFFEKGLAFRKKAPVNWCPLDATVLANEQVHDGKCWRCGTEVVQKELEQWFFKITAYAQDLLDGHNELKPTPTQKGWPEKVLLMQKNWIGPSNGGFVNFPIVDNQKKPTANTIRIFTTRPDTLFGATFMVLAPEHPAVESLTTADKKESVALYREKAKKLTKFVRSADNREKTGEFTGGYALNPLTGQPIPVFISDYVLMDYGTGAIMAVPAHDDRDFAFATKFGIPIIQVIQPTGKTLPQPLKAAFIDDGHLINSGTFSGLTTEEAQVKIPLFLKEKGWGEPAVTYKLRDWLLSRQRYWGTPIPIIYCKKCGAVPVPEKDLPVLLPTDVEFTGEGESPLTQNKSWLNTPCPKCGGEGVRETDTMDTFVDSSWYYARYTDSKNTKEPFSPNAAKTWIPVHQYVGGVEHACMHLIYSRFFHKALKDMGYFQTNEPFASLLTQGMVTLGGSAMSKSKGNVVDPKSVIDRFGADTCRMFILFAAPPTQELEWSDSQVEGIWRFLNRVWRLAHVFVEGDEAQEVKRSLTPEANAIKPADLERLIHVTIQKVTTDIERDFGFNTAISSIMELVNGLYLYPTLGDALSKEGTEAVLKLLFPFAPHLAEELWEKFGHKTLMAQTPWPEANAQKMVATSFEMVVQVNGKVREKIRVAATATKDAVIADALQALAKRDLKITPLKTIFVPQKLVNFVVPGAGGG